MRQFSNNTELALCRPIRAKAMLANVKAACRQSLPHNHTTDCNSTLYTILSLLSSKTSVSLVISQP